MRTVLALLLCLPLLAPPGLCACGAQAPTRSAPKCGCCHTAARKECPAKADRLPRRPLRSALTLAALTLVVLLVLVAAGFVRGLECSLDVSGDPIVVLVHARTDPDNLEVSAVPGRTAPVLAAGVAAVRRRYGNSYV